VSREWCGRKRMAIAGDARAQGVGSGSLVCVRLYRRRAEWEADRYICCNQRCSGADSASTYELQADPPPPVTPGEVIQQPPPPPYRKRGIRPLPPVMGVGAGSLSAGTRPSIPIPKSPSVIGERPPPAEGVISPNVTDVATVSPNSFWGVQSGRSAPRQSDVYLQADSAEPEMRQVMTPGADGRLYPPIAAPSGKRRETEAVSESGGVGVRGRTGGRDCVSLQHVHVGSERGARKCSRSLLEL
jgi:hypothetical protein